LRESFANGVPESAPLDQRGQLGQAPREDACNSKLDDDRCVVKSCDPHQSTGSLIHNATRAAVTTTRRRRKFKSPHCVYTAGYAEGGCENDSYLREAITYRLVHPCDQVSNAKDDGCAYERSFAPANTEVRQIDAAIFWLLVRRLRGTQPVMNKGVARLRAPEDLDKEEVERLAAVTDHGVP
jgi:hypothetical protein